MTLTEEQLQKYRDTNSMLAGMTYEAIVDIKMWLAEKGFINPFDYVDEDTMKEVIGKLNGAKFD